MPIVSTELNEVAPEVPNGLAVEGDYICTINYPNTLAGLMPNGSYVIFDTITETARAFTGFDSTTSPTFSGAPSPCVVGHGGYFWHWQESGDNLARIDPATGGLTNFATPGGELNPAALHLAIGDYVVAFRTSNAFGTGCRRWQISTGTNFAFNGPSTGVTAGVACSDGYLYIQQVSASTWMQYDLATNTVIASAGSSALCYGRGVEYGGYLWFKYLTGITRLDPATLSTTYYSHSLIPGGNSSNGQMSDLVLGADNWLYCYGTSDYLIGFDPATGTFGKEALSPTRGLRNTIASCNGKLWIPSGEPLT